ncbi:MAG: DUF2267 domain-containing protein [Pseudomonadota bacterium]|nr:DUF2267 domain-containing protein [Pseudomonadota bacterium]
MQYRELVKKVQHYSGFSDQESEMALRIFVNTLGARLTPEERAHFAIQLPQDLKEEAMSSEESERFGADEFIRRVCNEAGVDESEAEKQILASWSATKEAVSPGEIRQIKAQLPRTWIRCCIEPRRRRAGTSRPAFARSRRPEAQACRGGGPNAETRLRAGLHEYRTGARLVTCARPACGFSVLRQVPARRRHRSAR